MTKTDAIKQIEKLVKYYRDNQADWEEKTYKEAQAREEFIDGFFEALGWQISGIPDSMSPEDKDVLVEYSIKDKTTKSLDYIFKVQNQHQFIVEAKKPSENICNPKHIFQSKTYGFLSKVPFVILTNFKELNIYDISEKPHIRQESLDLIFSCDFNDYIKNIDYLWDNFSKEAVLNKSLISLYMDRRKVLDYSLDKYEYGYIRKQGEELLDDTFLKDLDNIRLLLSKDIITNNRMKFTDKELNEMIERLINIILFIRFLEDNHIEDLDLLRKIINGKGTYLENIILLCVKLNKKYNGLLFHNYPILNEIIISNKILKEIILKLYYPESPYDFSKISIEILGQIFELYLSKKIIQQGNEVILEIKSEERRSNGIYYTPEYIVDNIIDNSLVPYLNKQTNSLDFKVARVLDFSCGSGVFLIKAYKKLIAYFIENTADINETYLFKNSSGRISLTMEAKKLILEYNIFGIDIDYQAIEIVKMSLYFTMLEEYYDDSSPLPLLPSLEKNIICGNSLVDLTFFDEGEELTEEYIEKINPFSWEDEGFDKFDLIVGNPPYLRIQSLDEEYAKFLKSNYTCSYSNFDISILFIEKGIQKLSSDGAIGMIIPNTILNSKYGQNLRTLMLDNNLISKIVNFKDCQIFKDSSTYTCLLFLDNNKEKEFKYININNIEKEFLSKKLNFTLINSSDLNGDPWFFSSDDMETMFLSKINKSSFDMKNLTNLEKIFVGLQPSIKDVFLLKGISEKQGIITCYSKALNLNVPIEKELLKKMLKGSKNIFRYKVETENLLLFPYRNNKKTSDLISISDMISKYPHAWRYLTKCKSILQEKDELKGMDYYKYIYKKNHLRFDQVKILIPSLCYGSRFALDKEGEYYFTGSGEGGGGGYSLILNEKESNYNYYNILGILNSIVISALIELKGKSKRGGWKGIDKTFIDNIPLPLIDSRQKILLLSNISKDTKRLDSIVTNNPKPAVVRMIKMLENSINKDVLELYDIKEEDIVTFIYKNNKN